LLVVHNRNEKRNEERFPRKHENIIVMISSKLCSILEI